MEAEIIWNSDSNRDFLADLRSFAMSLDYYQLVFDLTITDEKKYLEIIKGEYEILPERNENVFKCPNCDAEEFEIMEGEIKGKPALGLACLNCETYGAVFPNGF